MQSEQHQAKERGGCLSLYLAAALLFSVAGLVLWIGLAADPRVSRVVSPVTIILFVGILIAFIVCTWGTWQWKQWGLNGLFITTVLSNLIQFGLGVGEPARNLAALFIQPLILWLLVRNKMDWFE
jgi:hypothetical protein